MRLFGSSGVANVLGERGLR